MEFLTTVWTWIIRYSAAQSFSNCASSRNAVEMVLPLVSARFPSSARALTFPGALKYSVTKLIPREPPASVGDSSSVKSKCGSRGMAEGSAGLIVGGEVMSPSASSVASDTGVNGVEIKNAEMFLLSSSESVGIQGKNILDGE